MPKITCYRLSSQADQDLEEIYDYTKQEFCHKQAVKYLSGFEELFQKLIQNPHMGHERLEIKEVLRSIPKDSHVVFYRIRSGHIRIVRILHARKDLRNFSEFDT